MKKIFLSPLFIFVLIPLLFASKFNGTFFKSTYNFSPDLKNSDLMPFAVKGDSVLVKVIEPIFSLDTLNFYRWDIIVDPMMVQQTNILYKKMDKEPIYYDNSLYDVCIYQNQKDGFFSEKDIYDKIRTLAPHGFVDSWGWRNNIIGHAEPHFAFTNLCNKTIKYITFYVQYENAVGDPIKSWRNNSSVLSYRGIGPVEPDSTESWSWEDSDPYFIENANKAKITKIVLEYMDGSKYTLIKELKFRT